MPAGTEFSISAHKLNASLGMVCFDFTTEYADKINLILAPTTDDFSPNDVLKTEPFEDCPLLNEPFVAKNSKNLKASIFTIINEFHMYDKYFKVKCSGLLKYLLCMTIQSHDNMSNQYDYRTNCIIEYINDHFMEKISNDDICKAIGYHPYYLNSIVKQQTGKTIHYLLTEKRIAVAKRLLTITEKPIVEIAEDCGFLSQTHFSNCFKKNVNMTPSEYRSINTAINTKLL